eukprot:447150_1
MQKTKACNCIFFVMCVCVTYYLQTFLFYFPRDRDKTKYVRCDSKYFNTPILFVLFFCNLLSALLLLQPCIIQFLRCSSTSNLCSSSAWTAYPNPIGLNPYMFLCFANRFSLSSFSKHFNSAILSTGM